MQLLVFYVLSLCTALVSSSPQVQLNRTTLVGSDIAGLKLDFFGGIPYAEPPLGSLRLRPPVLKSHLNAGFFNASSFGLSCLQPGMSNDLISEDCLTINIFRPSGVTERSSLPVLFWTFGGGFDSGSATTFNGSAIVAQSVIRGTPIIYVNFNYRLGPLGFPQGAEAASRGILNLAIRDQLAALEWVQINIGAFGGDKHKACWNIIAIIHHRINNAIGDRLWRECGFYHDVHTVPKPIHIQVRKSGDIRIWVGDFVPRIQCSASRRLLDEFRPGNTKLQLLCWDIVYCKLLTVRELFRCA